MHETPPSRSLKEKQRQEREDLIMQVTEEVLLEKGYHETSMDEIATRVGIAKGTLYLHFARKEDLVIALLQRTILAIQQIVVQTSTMDGTAKSRLIFILRSLYLDFLGKHGQLLYLVFNTSDLVSVLKERHREELAYIAQQIIHLLDEGKNRGEFDPTLPTPIMVSTFFSMLSPRIYRHMVIDAAISPEKLIFYVEHIYFNGITTQQYTDTTTKL